MTDTISPPPVMMPLLSVALLLLPICSEAFAPRMRKLSMSAAAPPQYDPQSRRDLLHGFGFACATSVFAPLPTLAAGGIDYGAVRKDISAIISKGKCGLMTRHLTCTRGDVASAWTHHQSADMHGLTYL